MAAECRRVIKILEERIRLCFVPGHSDILGFPTPLAGKEKADELARRGSLMETPYILRSEISLGK